MNGFDPPEQKERRQIADVALLVTSMALVAAYLMLRYGGRWGETDARTFTRAIETMFETGTLIPQSGYIYPNGYGYQALSVFLQHISGITNSQFQIFGHLILLPWLVVPAWLLYRELIGSGRGATLATFILLIQPEFLFPLLRGTHEKFTRGLILLALYIFVRSLGRRHGVARTAGYILAFYLIVYGFIAFNNFLAFSLITALLLAVLLLTSMRWWTRSKSAAGPEAETRLRYAVLIAGLMAFLFTFYFYTPARSNILVMDSMVDRTASLVLDVEYSEGANPYAYTAGAWISQPVYLAVSSANWLLLAISALIWFWQSFWLVMRRVPDWHYDHLLLWSLYGAFAFQGGLSILVDLSGALAANLQVRAFPAFVMLAAPLAAKSFMAYDRRTGRERWLVRGALTTVLSIMAVLSVLKATNEPLLSNKWTFYIPAEMVALDRAKQILADRPIWTGFDERLIAPRSLLDPSEAENKNLTAWGNASQNALVSDVTRARGERTFVSPPVEADSLITYDNGRAQIYHFRPRTPFQK